MQVLRLDIQTETLEIFHLVDLELILEQVIQRIILFFEDARNVKVNTY